MLVLATIRYLHFAKSFGCRRTNISSNRWGNLIFMFSNENNIIESFFWFHVIKKYFNFVNSHWKSWQCLIKEREANQLIVFVSDEFIGQFYRGRAVLGTKAFSFFSLETSWGVSNMFANEICYFLSKIIYISQILDLVAR